MAQAVLTTEKTYEIVSADKNFSAKRAKLFLHFLAERGRVLESARLAGFKDADALYYRRKHDEEFATAWQEALDRAGDMFEDEASRRAVEGVKKDVYYKGEVVGEEVVYSDGLLAKLMDGSKPDKYQRKKDAAQTNVHVQVGLAVVPMTNPQLEDWEKGSIEMHGAQQQIVDTTAEVVKAPEPPAAASQKTIRA